MTFLDSFPVARRRMTSEEAFASLQRLEVHRIGSTGAPITLDMTVRDWVGRGEPSWLTSLFQCSSEYWYDLAELFNQQFHVEIDDKVWKGLLRRSDATLGDVCDLLAAHAETEGIPEVNLTGRPCRPSGLFLALRSHIRRIIGREVSPSSPLPSSPSEAIYLSTALAHFARDTCIKPVPPDPTSTVVRWHNRDGRWCRNLVILGFVALILLGISEALFAWIFGLSFLAALVGGFALIALSQESSRFQWPGIQTYRDLVRQLQELPQE
jgi:hypothetical protein